MTEPLIKPYTAVPLDRPIAAFPGEDKLWTPMLKTRCFGKSVMPRIFLAVVDSGSPHCLFRADVAEFLKIDLSRAPKGQIGGIIGGPLVNIYFHKITLQIEDRWTFDVVGGFVKDLHVPIILGLNGFFDRFIVTFDHSTAVPRFAITKIRGPKQRVGF